MKVFQIFMDICYYDATQLYDTASEALTRYPPDVLFVDAPDYVFEGWGYDATVEGDERFIEPTPPEGWLYDEKTGTFYPETETAPSDTPSIQDDIIALSIDHEYRLTLMELGV